MKRFAFPAGRVALALTALLMVVQVAPAAQAAPGAPDTTIISGPWGDPLDPYENPDFINPTLIDENVFDFSTTPPTVTHAGFNYDAAPEKTVRFWFVSRDDPSATFECNLNGGGWFACGTFYPPIDPTTVDLAAIPPDFGDPFPGVPTLNGSYFKDYPGLGAGPYTFQVRATGAGGTDATPASQTFNVDMTAPGAASIDAGPAILVNTKTADFTFSEPSPATEPVHLECALDDPGPTTFERFDDQGVWSPCALNFTTPQVADGIHRLSVTALDRASNNGPIANWTWVVDTTPPNTTITGAPVGVVLVDTATITFTSNEAGTFECSLDGAAFAACTSAVNLTSLPDGDHNFKVRAIDLAGNKDDTPAEANWTSDVNPPQTTIDSGPSGLTNSTSATFTFSSSEANSTFECRLGGGGFSACTSPKTYTGLSVPGPHTFEVRATDAYGHTDPTPASRTWTIDVTAPDTFIDSGPTGTVATTDATFTFHSDDGTATFECRLDGGGFSACTSPKEYHSPVIDEGNHTFEVRAKDPAGNVDATPASRTWRVFTIATLTVEKGGDGKGSVVSDPVGLSCLDECESKSHDFAPNAVVTLTATEEENSIWGGWDDDCAFAGMSRECTLTLDDNKTATANFDKIAPQADGMLRSGNGAFVGDDVYNNDSTFQTVKSKTRAGRNASFDLKFENDGNAADKLDVTGCNGADNFAVKYVHDGKNVTGAVLAGKANTKMLGPGESETFRFVVSTSSRARGLFSCFIRTKSQTKPSALDVIRARVEIRG